MSQKIPIYIYSSHGVFEFLGKEEETLGAALRRAGIPLSAVSTYLVSGLRSRSSLSNSDLCFVSATLPLENITKKNKQIVVQLSRNISLSSLLADVAPAIRDANEPVAEWVFPDREKGSSRKILSRLSIKDCLDIVVECVKEVLKNWPKGEPRKMVVGISGGGDSNVLLSSLLKSGLVKPENIFPVMMLGIPDWDRQKTQAQKLCRNLNLKLEIVEAARVANIVSASSFSKLINQFKKEYPVIDLEFLGTFLIRRVLSYYAKLHKVGYVALGLNREDILSEGIVRISKGLLPLPAPFRKIGSATFVYPMWKIPKKIGDGAFPHYSLVNYENRSPGYSEGRSLYYYIAHALSEIAPGLDLTLLEGFSKLAALNKKPLVKDKVINDFLCRGYFAQDQLERWKRFLNSVSTDKKKQTS